MAQQNKERWQVGGCDYRAGNSCTFDKHDMSCSYNVTRNSTVSKQHSGTRVVAVLEALLADAVAGAALCHPFSAVYSHRL
jgi:hypothetical protein